MDPSTVRQSVAAVSRLKMAFWAVAFAVGGYLGYKIAEGLALSGLAVLGVIAGALLVATILVSLAVIAIIAALQPAGRGRSTAWAMILAGVLLVTGLGTGWLLKELGLGYRPSVFLEARGTMKVSLDGIDGYAGQVDALAICRSETDDKRVAFVEATDIGRVGTGVVGASVVILPQSSHDRPAVQVWIVPADKTVGGTPTWQGPVGSVERLDGDRGGRFAFTGAVLAAGDEAGLPVEGWPPELSGTIEWHCGAWLPSPSAQP